MSPRKRRAVRLEADDTRLNVARTSVIAIAAAQYSHLRSLPGARYDLGLIEDVLAENQAVSIYGSRFTKLLNPSANDIRTVLLRYTLDRSAKGDVLLFYFSGHGAIVNTSDFAFCASDTVVQADVNKVLSLSVVNFRDVVQTLSSADVFPVFIIDACFSGKTAPQGLASVPGAMHDQLHGYMPGTYALLASSGADTESFETVMGGVFTRALHSILSQGLDDEPGRHLPLLTLSDVSRPLQQRLVRDGYPLSKCYVGPDLPRVPLAKNAQFSPDSERLVPYMMKIIEYAWCGGNPREVPIEALLKNVGPGAYANHSKLSLPPWDLLEDGATNSTRRLTDRGRQFAEGELRVPREIIRDPVLWEWVPAPGTDQVSFTDLRNSKRRDGKQPRLEIQMSSTEDATRSVVFRSARPKVNRHLEISGAGPQDGG